MFALLSLAHFVDALEAMRSLIIEEYLGTITDAASVLAALIAGWSFIRISHDYIEGQGVTAWMFFKPIAMVIIVCNFNFFVLKPVHILTTMFTHELATNTEKAQDGFWKASGKVAMKNFASELNKVKSAWTDNLSNSPEEDASMTITEPKPTFGQKLKKYGMACWATLTGISVSVSEAAFGSITMVLYGLLSYLLHIVYYVQICLCYIFLTLYGLMGPFAFAFAILPSFGKGVADWISRYVQISFWIPVGQLVFLIGYHIMLNTANLINGDVGVLGKFASNAGVFSAQLMSFNIGSWMSIILIIATMFAIFQVPKFCTGIIESVGSAGAEAGIARNVGSAARTAAHAAKLLA